jgi:alkanesulfonate monooxygenase SsuD/methylene tetrahydromethanopterin reductase-like flavin-dependent oxidoreductase (luciferase family)
MTAPQQPPTVTETSGDAAMRSGRPIKIGLNLQIIEGGMAGKTPRWADLLAFAQRAEAVGFDSLWIPDHLLLAWGGQTRGIWECWSLLAALAAVTRHVDLGPLVTCANFRYPALQAKMADTVEEISGGRLILGLGAGWSGSEETAFGYPSDHRVDRFEEALQIIAPLLRAGHVDFEGRYYQARGCELRPRGPRPSGPPILIGAKGPRMLRLAATYADLWNAEGPLRQPEQFIPLRAAGEAACAETGRDPATLGRSASVVIDLPIAGESQQGDRSPSVRGEQPEPTTPEAVAELLRGYAREGLSHIQVWLSPSTIAGVEWFASVLDALDRTGEEYGSHVT